MDTVAETRDLVKSYGATRAVDGLDLRVPRGSVFGLLGQNGAGKSTTLRCLLGLVKPSAGKVLLLGEAMPTRRLSVLSRVGALIEGPAFYPYLSGARNLLLLGRLARPAGVDEAAVRRALERVGLADRGGDPYRGYSTGMRQRLGIAAAILHDPELVVLDEPMSGLDPPAVVRIRQLIAELRAEGKTVLLSSHMLHEVELACDEVAIIEGGRVVAAGSVAELLHPEAARVEVDTTESERALELARALPQVSRAELRPGGIVVELPAEESAQLNRALVGGGVPVSALRPRAKTLEELYHELAGSS